MTDQDRMRDRMILCYRDFSKCSGCGIDESKEVVLINGACCACAQLLWPVVWKSPEEIRAIYGE